MYRKPKSTIIQQKLQFLGCQRHSFRRLSLKKMPQISHCHSKNWVLNWYLMALLAWLNPSVFTLCLNKMRTLEHRCAKFIELPIYSTLSQISYYYSKNSVLIDPWDKSTWTEFTDFFILVLCPSETTSHGIRAFEHRLAKCIELPRYSNVLEISYCYSKKCILNWDLVSLLATLSPLGF